MARNRSRSTRNRRSNYSRKSGNVLIAVVMLTVAVLIAGGFGYLYYKGSSKERLDEATLCPNSGAKGHLVVLVDLTDPASMTQMRFARTKIEREIDEAGVGTLISIGVVTPDTALREGMLLAVCKPPSGAEADTLTENAKMIEDKFQDRFAQPLDRMLTKIMTVSEAPSSPIMENLQELLSRIPEFDGSTPQKLVLFSNLSQHSDVLSFYRGDDWAKFEAIGGLAKLARNLSDTDVLLLRLPEPQEQRENLEDFWVNYFEAQGASSVATFSVGEI
jgi:hypothetical protein